LTTPGRSTTAGGRAGRALSFGAIAEDYDRFRPGPPVAALDWLLPRRRRAVVEIGAGTGALTRLLLDRVDRVVAAEPDLRMAGVLTTRVPGAAVVAARAEELPLIGGRLDAVLGSSMWHWVEEERAVAEAARVLRPGGRLGVLWSGPDRTRAWVDDLLTGSGLVRRPAAETPVRHHRRLRLPPDAPFSEAETQTTDWSWAVAPEDLVGLIGTYSGFIVRPEAERRELKRAVTDVVSGHAALTDSSQFELPMRCICWRAERLV
jgi:SAM-dependent methyltransferase